VQGVGQLADEELTDLMRVAIGEARRRGIGSVSQDGESSQRTAPVEERATPIAGRTGHQTAPMGDIPPAKANMIRAAIRADTGPIGEIGSHLEEGYDEPVIPWRRRPSSRSRLVRSAVRLADSSLWPLGR
jgi:hypothetical protein